MKAPLWCSPPAVEGRLVIDGETRAEDGMDLMRVETFQAASPEQLPSEAELAAKVTKIAQDLEARFARRSGSRALAGARHAPSKRAAAAVFFHEVLGHRCPRRPPGSATKPRARPSPKKVNQQILPAFLSVTDDPTRSSK